MIFVFGSNLRGVHGAGAAKTAFEKYGAIWECGLGRAGRSFAIPTKDHNLKTLSIEQIDRYVHAFRIYAECSRFEMFQVTQIGCGLAGYTPKQIAPLFTDCPGNCFFDTAWKPYLPSTAIFWGTYK